MGNLILKVDRDPESDRYCVWSTQVEAPIFDGTRAELEKTWAWEYGQSSLMGLAAGIERANEKGSSSTWDGDFDEDHGPTYRQMGSVIRSRLGELLDAEKGHNFIPPMAKPFLYPWDDEET